MNEAIEQRPAPVLAGMGLVLGALALLVAVIAFWSPPAAPPASAKDRIGAVRDAAVSAVFGVKVEAVEVARPWHQARWLALAIAVAAVLAIIGGLVGWVRGENARYGGAATLLGVTALVFQFVASVVPALLAVLLIAALVTAFGDFLGGCCCCS